MPPVAPLVQGRAPPPAGLAKEKAEWLKPGLVGRVKFLKGRRSYGMLSLREFREE